MYTDGYYVSEDGTRMGALSSRRRAPMSGRVLTRWSERQTCSGHPCACCFVSMSCAGTRSGSTSASRLAPTGISSRISPMSACSATWTAAPASTACTARTSRCGPVPTSDGSIWRPAAQTRSGCRASPIVRQPASVGLSRSAHQRTGHSLRAPTGGAWLAAVPGPPDGRAVASVAADGQPEDRRRRGQNVGGGVLRESRALNPSDRRARLLLALHDVSPAICRTMLRVAGSGAQARRAVSSLCRSGPVKERGEAVRLLIVSTWLPYPPDNGSRVRAYHLLRHPRAGTG